jgi:hypothetical protein
MRVISRGRTALLCAETGLYQTGSKLDGQIGLSEVTHYRQTPPQGYKSFTIVIILWLTFKVGHIYFLFVTIPQIFLDLRKAEILLCS